jgi:hypothetical protein
MHSWRCIFYSAGVVTHDSIVDRIDPRIIGFADQAAELRRIGPRSVSADRILFSVSSSTSDVSILTEFYTLHHPATPTHPPTNKKYYKKTITNV